MSDGNTRPFLGALASILGNVPFKVRMVGVSLSKCIAEWEVSKSVSFGLSGFANNPRIGQSKFGAQRW